MGKKKHIIAVYGTLRNGEDKIDYIRGTMLNCGAFPSIRHDKNGDRVEIEIKHVTEKDLIEFDRYEGLDAGLYKRVKVTTEGGLEVWLYEGDKTFNEKCYAKINADKDGIVRWHGGNVFERDTIVCLICGNPIVSGEYYNVNGGGSVHKECYDRLMASKG